MVPSAMHTAVQAIIREHQQLAVVVGGMQRFIELVDAHAQTPDAIVFRAMLYYIREYPEQIHHPKEDCYLFARLRMRTADLDEIIEELEHQHAQGEAKVRELERAFTRYELADEAAFAALRDSVYEYARFFAEHRRLEEELILPAALRFLTHEDWIEIDAAFGANRDPFEGMKTESDLDHLFEMVVKAIPDLGG
ncbi:Hemerythrin domain-containing protein [Paraburkholderia kururiensis]|uniref:hemerythrin domain-containing protein n=1 Tax=Paraburkholderia kururiensis TaxID=984307 RepID=UPI0039A416DD